MSGVSSWVTDLNNSIQDTVNYITNNNYLEYAVMSGFGDVPIAAYGMVIIVLSTLTYATVADSKNITDFSNITYNMVKSIPGLTTTDSAVIDKQFATEKEELKEEEKQREKEEAEYKRVTEEEEKENDKLKEEEKEKKEEEEEKSKKKDEDEEDEDEDEDEKAFKGGIKGTHGFPRSFSLRAKIPPSNKGIKRSTKKKRKIN
jgi:hypothetical protein